MMITAGLNKLLTPPLAVDDRYRFLETWGLGEFFYRFGELTQDLVLRQVDYLGRQSQPLLTHLRTDEWRALLVADPTPCIEKRYSSPLNPAELPAETSLWEETFPYPFSLLPVAVSPIHSSLSASPPTFSEIALRTCAAFARLEQFLSGSEVGILWLCRGEARFPLLLHSVRKKRLRVGTGEFLMSIGRSFESHGLTPDSLFSQFGTAVNFIQVTLPVSGRSLESPFTPLLEMAHAITTSLASPSLGIHVRPGEPLEKGDFRL